jgi:hypothetical protein
LDLLTPYSYNSGLCDRADLPSKKSYRVCKIFSPLIPLLGSSLPYWSTGLITHFLDLSQAAGLLGRVISSSQGLSINTGQYKYRKTRTHIKHPCPMRDSNQQSRPPSDRKLFMPQTARLLRPACKTLRNCKSGQGQIKGPRATDE